MAGKRQERHWDKEHFVGGKFSRDKGMREERALVQHLIDLGYTGVKRVPLSGASRGFKFDVLATRDDKQYSFELKTKADGFTWVYDFLFRTGLSRFSYLGVCVSLVENPKESDKSGFDNVFRFISDDHPELKDIRRVIRLMELKKDADFLVVKSNNKKRIFIRYFGHGGETG